jgi:hypothetical protein
MVTINPEINRLGHELDSVSDSILFLEDFKQDALPKRELRSFVLECCGVSSGEDIPAVEALALYDRRYHDRAIPQVGAYATEPALRYNPYHY